MRLTIVDWQSVGNIFKMCLSFSNTIILLFKIVKKNLGIFRSMYNTKCCILITYKSPYPSIVNKITMIFKKNFRIIHVIFTSVIVVHRFLFYTTADTSRS